MSHIHGCYAPDGLFILLNSLGAMGQLVLLAVNSWKMPGISQSTLFIFQIVNLPLCQAAANTLINTGGSQSFRISRTCLL